MPNPPIGYATCTLRLVGGEVHDRQYSALSHLVRIRIYLHARSDSVIDTGIARHVIL